jgi:uncharacterized cupin superfamily protein
MARPLDLSRVPVRLGSGYPSPFDAPCRTRRRERLGKAAGLTQFGVNRLTLQPGTWSSQRHWHTHEDEWVMVLEGEVVLVSNDGEQRLVAGDAVGFPAGVPDAHHFQNRSPRPAILLEVGTCADAVDQTEYPDIDLRARPDGYVHRDGTPYPVRD